MRDIAMTEVAQVAGGTDAATGAKNVCIAHNLPDDTKVTITNTANANAGLGGNGIGTQTTVTIETTCGALRGG